MILLLLTLSGVSSFAITKHHTSQIAAAPTEIKGQATQIRGHALMVKDEASNTRIVITPDPKTIDGIKVGDNVDVKFENGKMVSGPKIGGKTST